MRTCLKCCGLAVAALALMLTLSACYHTGYGYGYYPPIYGGTYKSTIIHPDRSRTTYTTSYWGNTSTTRVRRTHR
jgi:hypothetical protein